MAPGMSCSVNRSICNCPIIGVWCGYPSRCFSSFVDVRGSPSLCLVLFLWIFGGGLSCLFCREELTRNSEETEAVKIRGRNPYGLKRKYVRRGVISKKQKKQEKEEQSSGQMVRTERKSGFWRGLYVRMPERQEERTGLPEPHRKRTGN